MAEMTQKQRKIGLARLLSLILLLLLYFFVAKPSIVQAILFVVTLLSVGIYLPLYEKIDKLDPWLYKGLAPLKLLLIQPIRYIHKHLGRFYNIVVTVLLVGILLFLFTQDKLIHGFNQVRDVVCIQTTLSIQGFCEKGIGMESLKTKDGETIQIGLIAQNIGRETGSSWTIMPFDTSDEQRNERDIEEKIFAQNKKYCTGNHTYITLAVVTMLSRTLQDDVKSANSANVGLEDLRGAYLAQQGYNDSSAADATKICLVIANTGTNLTRDEATPPVLKRLTLYSKYEPTFRGIVGFPFSNATRKALDTLTEWDKPFPSFLSFIPRYSLREKPIVSPSAMSDTLNNEINFYRIANSNAQQSNDLVDFLIGGFKAKSKAARIKVAILRDPSDEYSNNLATGFSEAVKGTKKNPITNIETFVEDYQVQDPTKLTQALERIIEKKPDYLFFSGYAYDLDTVEDILQRNKVSIPIIGGEGIYGLDRYIPKNTYSLIYSGVYTRPLGETDPFMQLYKNAFSDTSHFSPTEFFSPHAILAYEATSAYVQTLNKIAEDKKTLSQKNITDTLKTINFTGVTFQGYAETIIFDGTREKDKSNPSQKIDYILCTDKTGNLHVAAEFVPNVAEVNFLLKDVENCQE